MKGFVIAGPTSGAGKTTVSLAVMAALRKRGMAIQPFKCGPDFIDGGHHTRACGRASRNLDGWMLTPEANREIFSRAAQGADLCAVEGVMGLFDGVDGASETGSTAEMAKLLELPVILVVDASSMARSAAALVHGFATFDPGLRLAGVIFNKAAGTAHYRFLHDALMGKGRAAALGYLPLDERIRIPERYLGLLTAAEELLPDAVFAHLAELAEENIDLEGLLACSASVSLPAKASRGAAGTAVRIGVARDPAFSFYYDDNLDALREAGAALIEFSPLRDAALPEALDALYIGGGYPELFAGPLAANRGMLSSVQAFAREGRPVYAECGGLMYLAKEISTREGKPFAMAGVLPLSVRMTDRLVNFGYTEVSFRADCLLGAKGAGARGHSFHCSAIEHADATEPAYRARNSMTGREEPEGFQTGNVLASYIHLHFLSNPRIAPAFVSNVRRAGQARLAEAAKKG